MAKNKPLIVWQKWADPFGQDEEETKWTDYDSENPSVDNASDLSEATERQDKNKTFKVIASPLGLIPYTEHTASGKIFNFWTGHTNFDLTKNIIDHIEKVGGVETLDVFTRYRFRIAIGKCFNDAEVMRNINSVLYNLY